MHLEHLGVGTVIAITRGYDCLPLPAGVGIFERGKMLKITRTANGEVVFAVSDRMDAENIAELQTMFNAEASGRRVTLDLKELTLVDHDAVRFLMRCEADDIQLKNYPAYIRE